MSESQKHGHWFVIADGIVRGPFSTLEVESSISNWSSPLIWGRGLGEWTSAEQWRSLKSSGTTQASSPNISSTSSDTRLWKLRVDGHELKPMSFEQMLEAMKSRDDFSDIQVWTEGYSEWREIFQVHQIADELGVSRRKHPRVPIMGSISCESPDRALELKALSISEGGLGASDGKNMSIGERFKSILKSPNLYGPIHANVEVVYAGPDGYVGLRFLGIQEESRSAIIEYVRKFEDEKTVAR